MGFYPHSRAPESLPPGVAAWAYAPYSEVFPRAAALDVLLRDPAYATAAQKTARRIQSEDGAGAAAAAIEQMLT